MPNYQNLFPIFARPAFPGNAQAGSQFALVNAGRRRVSDD